MTSRLELRLLKVIELQAAALAARTGPVALAPAPNPDRAETSSPPATAADDPAVGEACTHFSFGDRAIERSNRLFARKLAREGKTAEAIVAAITRGGSPLPSDEDEG